MDKIFIREAKKLLRRLTKNGGYIKTATQKNEEDKLELWNKQAKKPLDEIDKTFLRRLLSYDLIKKQKEFWVISDGGLRFLQRQVKPDYAFRAQHCALSEEKNSKGETYTINLNENPLFWLHSRKGTDGKAIISQSQMKAGCRLQNDFFSSTAKPRMVVDLTKPYISKQTAAFEGAPMTERAMVARGRLQAALKMLGPGLADIALEVCCYQQGLESAEKHLGWPRRAGKVVLQIALERLTGFYKLH